MTLISEPKKQLEEDLNKIYGSYTSGQQWIKTPVFTKELYKKHGLQVGKNQGENYKNDLSTYGELTFKGLEIIIRRFREHFNENSVFYDLGSGYGKVVSHVALRTDTDKSIGVEYDQGRVDDSLELIEKIKFPRATPRIIQGDILDQDYSDATIVYFDNTMYHKHFLVKLINEMLPKGCLLIYKNYGLEIGDRFIKVETSYSSNHKYSNLKETDRLAWEWWFSRASYRIIGEVI